MNTRTRLGMVAALACLLMAWQPVAAEPLDGQLGDALGKLRHEGEELFVQLRAGLEQARAAVNEMGVEARVYARLHWDKALSAAELSVDVDGNGVATLTGVVPSEQAKVKAAALTQDTVGIERVVNELTVAAAPAR